MTALPESHREGLAQGTCSETTAHALRQQSTPCVPGAEGLRDGLLRDPGRARVEKTRVPGALDTEDHSHKEVLSPPLIF